MAYSTDSDYFKSYSSLNVHELMIKDKPRTEAYQQFIAQNLKLFKGKVILDVGAGTGILSLFAARSGAKKVYAVEASDVADLCEEIVATNLYSSKITVVKGRIETVELPEKVDVIVSEWMGFYLLHESMLDSVLYARDKWLKEDGVLLPSHAAIYACPVNMTEFCKETFECWEDVYGFDFSPFQERTVAAHLQQPAVTNVSQEQLLSDPQELAKFELKTMKLSEVQELDDKLAFLIGKGSVLHGFTVWFDVRFTPDIMLEHEYVKVNKSDMSAEHSAGNKNHSSPIDNHCTVPRPVDSTSVAVGKDNCSTAKQSHCTSNNTDTAVTNCSASNNNKTTDVVTASGISPSVNHVQHVTLDTSPTSPLTHWKQTVCFLPVTVPVEKDDTIYCKIALSQDDANKRHYNISLQMLESLDDTDDSCGDDSDDLEEDMSRHPIPCECGAGRCKIIAAIMEKYDEEQTEIEMEAEFTDVSAEVQAAQSLDNEETIFEDS